MSPNSLMQAILPSMFHRRLVLLLVLTVLGMLPLSLRLSRLTLVKGDSLREDAERRLVRRGHGRCSRQPGCPCPRWP